MSDIGQNCHTKENGGTTNGKTKNEGVPTSINMFPGLKLIVKNKRRDNACSLLQNNLYGNYKSKCRVEIEFFVVRKIFY